MTGAFSCSASLPVLPSQQFLNSTSPVHHLTSSGMHSASALCRQWRSAWCTPLISRYLRLDNAAVHDEETRRERYKGGPVYRVQSPHPRIHDPPLVTIANFGHCLLIKEDETVNAEHFLWL